jgi:hypothetical protein
MLLSAPATPGDRGGTVLAHTAAGSRIVGAVAFALFTDYLIYGLLIPLTPYSPARATSEAELGLLRLASSSPRRSAAISAIGSAIAG